MKPARHVALATLACSLVLSLALPLHVAHADDDDPVAPPGSTTSSPPPEISEDSAGLKLADG
ncbi:OmpA family protein, partial [Kitasatospora sp. NPDC056808]